MKTEACLKFKMPKEQYLFELYLSAENMHQALVGLNKFLFSGNRDLTLEDIQGYFTDAVKGLPL